ncbi:MAG: hypothetical protein RSA66_07900 [Muribaculaceae bacterium]
MRTISEIKESIATDFMANETIAEAYSFTAGSDFNAEFSKVSLENTLFYVFACAAWVIESLFESHKNDVETSLDNKIPHRTKWYRNKVLQFMKGKTLIEDTDRYNTSELTDDEVAALQVVKHATATENSDASMLTIKVAGESAGQRCKLPIDTQKQLAAYLAEIKDAGVRINLVNSDPDTLSCDVDIYYNPMLTTEVVQESCEKVIKQYIENLPFNGEYTNMALVDVLQRVEGVKVIEFNTATAMASGKTLATTINGRYTPAAGYFKAGKIAINMIAYE